MNFNANYPESMDRQKFALLEISFINKVYGIMTLGLLLTAVTAWQTYQSVAPEKLMTWMFPCCLLEVVVVIALSWVATRVPPLLSLVGFLLYSVLNGFTLSVIFYGYQIASIWQVFLTTSVTFALMSGYGVITKRDLTSLGNLLFMVLLGMIVAGILNIFFRSSGLDLALSILGVIVFAGLTAYDTQKLKNIHETG
ncbi:MAG: Bax inhibitor-1/YccA family protein, partial [Oligosphaeraceae bacterium]